MPIARAKRVESSRIASNRASVEADQVHLVHREHEVPDAEQAGDARVAAGLGQHALARVDQHQGEVGVGGAGRHVAGILLVARACRRG